MSYDSQEKFERRYAKAGLSDHSWSGSAMPQAPTSQGAPTSPGSPASPGGLHRSRSENLEGERVRCESCRRDSSSETRRSRPGVFWH